MLKLFANWPGVLKSTDTLCAMAASEENNRLETGTIVFIWIAETLFDLELAIQAAVVKKIREAIWLFCFLWKGVRSGGSPRSLIRIENRRHAGFIPPQRPQPRKG